MRTILPRGHFCPALESQKNSTRRYTIGTVPSSASFFVFRFWPKMAKYAYFKEPFLTHLISLKRVQDSGLIRTFCARKNMTAFLSERYLSYNLSSKMTISHSGLAGTEIFRTMNMPEIFEISNLT